MRNATSQHNLCSGKIKKYIDAQNLLDKNTIHIVALSGGADSVCLLRVMLLLGYKIHAVHCNFHLRGEESDRDENFCKELCSKFDVPLHLAHFDTKAYAQEHHVSIEMAARDLRYSYFEQLRVAIDASDIVVAHHRDDNVETLLMNLIRGTGLKGLQGMKPRNGYIIRPMLSVSREEIVNYLTLLNQNYITDSSNLVDDVVRNKIRLNVIPLLKNINPAAIENITRTIQNISESAKIIDEAIRQGVKNCVKKEGKYAIVKKSEIMSQPSPEQALFTILSPYGFSPRQIKQIHDNINVQSGKTWCSSDWTIAADRESFIIGKNISEDYGIPIKIPETGIYNIYKEGEQIIVSECIRDEDFIPSKDAFYATIDANKVTFPITVRGKRHGDRFRPFGMKGAKLVSDYMTDKKRNYFQRIRQLLVEDANGNIIWLIGERVSQKVVCNVDTIKVLTLRYIDKSSNK